jgi:uncharacterized membrane protein (UPF0127 family)
MKYGIFVILSVVAIIGALVMTGNMPSEVLKIESVEQAEISEKQAGQATATATATVVTNATEDDVQKTVSAVKEATAEPIAPMSDVIEAFEPSYEDVSYTDEAGETHVFKVERAEKLAEVQKGLMFRRDMPRDQGMLFVFPNEGERGFWMKNTYIPLDMFFIRADGTIHKIHKGAVPHDTTIIRSEGSVKYVLEMNAGIADEYGIKVGDKFDHENFVIKLAE